MTWTKLSDEMPERRAIWGLSDGAFRLHVTALVYSNRMLTEQLVPADRLVSLVPRFKAATADELVAAGAWQREGDDYRILDSADDQLARADVLALREKRAAAGRRGGLEKARRHAGGLANGVASAVANDVASAVANGYPGPSRPEGRREELPSRRARRMKVLQGEERLPQTPTRPTRDDTAEADDAAARRDLDEGLLARLETIEPFMLRAHARRALEDGQELPDFVTAPDDVRQWIAEQAAT